MFKVQTVSTVGNRLNFTGIKRKITNIQKRCSLDWHKVGFLENTEVGQNYGNY